MRTARDLKTSASINVPVPAIVHAISAPSTPVWAPNRRGNTNTPDPTMEPTTIAVSVRMLTFLTD